MQFRTVLFFLLLFAAFPLAAAAQDGDEKDVIKVDTQLVDVPVAVINPDGSPVKALKASNFVVFEDGKRQEVADFSTASAPFEVALLLDTSGSTRSDLQLIQRAALDFISSLRPGDRVAIVAFKTDRQGSQSAAVPDVVIELTSDRSALRNAVQNIKTSNGTPLYDALLEMTEEIFGQQPAEQYRGRRALVALTDGVDSTSGADFSSVKDSLGSLGIIAFFIKVDTQEFFEETLLGDCATAIRFSNAQIRRYYRSIGIRESVEKAANFCQLGDFERLAVSKKLYQLADSEMALLAKISGGKVFPADDLANARNAFKNVAAEIGTKYTLGYYPTNEKRDGTYRKIKVEVRGLPAGVQVRAREGYTAPRQ